MVRRKTLRMVLPRPAMFTCATHGDEKRATSIVNIGRPIFKVYISNDLDCKPVRALFDFLPHSGMTFDTRLSPVGLTWLKEIDQA